MIATPPLRLALMGGFDLTCDGRGIALPHSAQRLMAFLAVSERPVRRCHAAATLWLDTSEERSSGSLRTALWRLRRAGQPLLDLRGDCMSLSRDLAVDVRALWETGRRLIGGDGALDRAAARELLGAGELLPGWYDEWVVVERERTRELRIQALEAASLQLTARGRRGEAVLMAHAAVEADPLRESARRTLIAAQVAAGNHAEALRQHRRYAEVLRRELRLAPSPEMQQLAEALQRGASA